MQTSDHMKIFFIAISRIYIFYIIILFLLGYNFVSIRLEGISVVKSDLSKGNFRWIWIVIVLIFLLNYLINMRRIQGPFGSGDSEEERRKVRENVLTNLIMFGLICAAIRTIPVITRQL